MKLVVTDNGMDMRELLETPVGSPETAPPEKKDRNQTQQKGGDRSK